MEKTRDQLRGMIEGLRVGSLVTVDNQGTPTDRVMYTAIVEDDFTLYFAVARDSGKFAHVQVNPGVICFWPTGNGYISLKGRAEGITDQSVLDSAWQDSFSTYFPGGSKDPNYAIIRIRPVSLTYYDCGSYSSQEIDF